MTRCKSVRFLSVLTLLLWLSSAEASHFRFGSIAWSPTPGSSSNNTVTFTFRLAFRRSFSHAYYCDENTKSQGSLIGYGGSWRAACSDPSNPQCSGTIYLRDTGFVCTDFSINEDWSMGENNFTYTFPSNNLEWTARYTSCCWISSLSRYGDSSWLVSGEIDLTPRPDNGKINSSPVTKSLAIVRFQQGCPKEIRIPVEDPDGDTVKCRWASVQESSIPSDSFPYGFLEETTCVLKYGGRNGTAGTYAVTLTLEDFPAGTTNFDNVRPFSAVGLQFLVIISGYSGPCDDIPVFTDSTPEDGECSEIQIGSAYTAVIEVQLADFAKHVVEITTSSPLGMQITPLHYHQGVYYRNVTWYPSQYQFGQNLFCFQAVDSSGLQSSLHCVTILVGLSNTPQVILGSQSPKYPLSESGRGLIWWSIQFDRLIKKPRSSAYIRLVLQPNSYTVYKVDTLSQYVIIDSNRTVLHFAMPKAALSMNGSYAILIDHGAVVGQGCSYDGPPTPGITSPSDWGFPVDGVCPVGLSLAPPGFTNCVDVDECASHSRSKRSFWPSWWPYLFSTSTAAYSGSTASASSSYLSANYSTSSVISPTSALHSRAVSSTSASYSTTSIPSTTVISPTPGSTASASSSYLSECSHHSYLEDSVRGVGFYNGYYGYYQCDSNLPSGWYRFRGAAGTEMPTSCVGKNRCSSHAPGWLDGSHPSVADGAVHATVCFHWNSGCCTWSKSIRVRNCSGFYVYELGPTPTCWLRYCGNGGANYSTSSVISPTSASYSTTSIPSTTVISPTPGQTISSSLVSQYPSECSNHSYLEDADRAMGFSRYLGYYRCDNNLPSGWYRFRGAAGTEMPTSCVGRNRCGTHVQGWLSGSHPSVADGAVHATVCFHWSWGCCSWSTSIRVRNCSGFYVYELGPPPYCYLRYCGNGGASYSTTSIPSTTVISPTPASISLTTSASTTPVSPGSCSYTLTDLRGNFTSPNYPYDYPLSLTCNWTISVTPGYFIYLHFEHFHLEHAWGQGGCPYDFVEIFDGSSSSSPLIAKRCDYQDSWCVYSTSNVLHVNFVSDYIIARSGFSAYYERVHTRYPMCLHLNSTLHSRTDASTPALQVTPTSSYFQATSSIPGSCYYHLSQPSGTFASLNHPGCYPNDKYCTWLIEAPSGQYIYLHFLSFHLEYGSAYCPWDFVEIFDGHSEYRSSKIIRACGQLAPWTVYSSGRFLLVKFYSDAIIMMPGFSAYYQAVSYTYSVSLPPPQVSITSSVQCYATHTATASATTATTTVATTSSNVNGIHPTPASAMPSSFYAASSVNVLPNPSQFELHLPSGCEQICSNTYGSYTCSCVGGYQLAPDGKSCLDIDECSISNGGCSHHCFNIPGSFYCGCPEGRTMGANNLTCVEPGVSVDCGDSNMTVALEKRTFPFFEVGQLHLRYSSCRATQNDTHLLVSTTLNGCGTLVNETQDALIFWNEIQADVVIINNVITRTHDIKLPFYCSYSRRKMLSLSFTPQPVFFLTEAGYGNLTFKIDFYKSSSFITPYSQQDYPLVVELNDYVYVRYSVESSADLTIMAVTCKATKTGSSYSWPQYTIIQNGCPRDTTMDYSYDPLRNFQQFKIKAFRFFDDYDTVYFHCELLACHRYSPNSRCNQGCSIGNKRKKRDVTRDEVEHEESTNKVILTQGPVVFKKEEQQQSGDTEQNKQTGALIGGAAAAGGFGLIAFIALAVLFVKYRIARRFMNRNKVGDLYTTQDEQMSRKHAYIQEDDMIDNDDVL